MSPNAKPADSIVRGGQSPYVIRAPQASDAAGIWRLVQATPVLDTNSPYAYLLLCTDFAQTGAVAEGPDGLAGFVLGYRPPARSDAFFVWQVGVAESDRGYGLGHALLRWVVQQNASHELHFLEATVTPSNQASWSLFKAFARSVQAPLLQESAFPSHLFPSEGHEEELRIRIGPFSS